MARTIIRIEQADLEDPVVVFRPDEPSDVPEHNVLKRLDCDVSTSPFSDLALQQCGGPSRGVLVRDAGNAIFARLARHPGVKAALERIGSALPGESCPIFLRMTAEAAEPLPFEMLFLPGRGFLALDHRSPIVRIAADREFPNGTIRRQFQLPLHVTIVIAASDREVFEDEEWRVIYDAFRTGQMQDFHLQVHVARDELRDIIDASHDGRIEVHTIGDDVDQFIKIISAFRPALLHFFCHGTTKTAPYLQISTRNSHAMGDEPLFVGMDAIERLANSVWLVTLNACQGAAPVPNAQSLALSMANAGVPAVIGMREAIEARDANLFSGAFYKELLAELARVLSAAPGETPDWGALMRAPRTVLRSQEGAVPDQAAAAHKRWSLPVLYVRPERLQLERVEPQSPMDLLGKYNMLVTVRSRLDRSTPRAMLDEIDAHIAETKKALDDLSHD